MVEEESVHARIRRLIMERRIPPGERIVIDRLARHLGVSQTPVREALRRLEGDGLVLPRQPRGYGTSDVLTAAQLGDLFEVRLLLEPWAARDAATRGAVLGELLTEEIARFQRAQESGPEHGSPTRNFTHDQRFHALLLEGADDSVLRTSFDQLHAHLHLFRLFPADLDGECTLVEHTAIADAIRSGDPDAAEAAMTAHLHQAFERFSEGVAEEAL